MIRLRRGSLAEAAVEAVIRPIRSDGSATTGPSRRLELGAGASVGERLGEMGETPVGGAVITPGGDLPSAFLIHVVVQSRDEPVTASGLRRAFTNGLRRAADLGIRSVAFPLVGAGPGHLDAEEAAHVLGEVLADHLETGSEPTELVFVVEEDYQATVVERLITTLDAGGEEE